MNSPVDIITEPSTRESPFVPPTASRSGLWASQLGLRANWPGLKANQLGLGANQPGLRALQLGLRASKPGLRAGQSGLRASEPGFWSSLSDLRSSQLDGRKDRHREFLPILQDVVSGPLPCFLKEDLDHL